MDFCLVAAVNADENMEPFIKPLQKCYVQDSHSSTNRSRGHPREDRSLALSVLFAHIPRSLAYKPIPRRLAYKPRRIRRTLSRGKVARPITTVEKQEKLEEEREEAP